ncbi:D-alanyl-D-alanine carboxypeptidase/D-alanyl-D-alanine-endopeptidase [bacterium]|nr:D-alanyl-D-alanine carboxypeptidase/D-alanyl-D-alanine-endopeptidase [bacterium]
MKYLFVILFTFPLTASSQDFYSNQKLDSITSAIDAVFAERLFKDSKVGFIAKSLNSSQILYEKNSEALLSSASCMKLVTTAAALDRWGSNYQFRTGFYGNFSKGLVDSNLYVKGYGDPYFTSEILLRTVYHLKAMGLSEIKGNIIADDSYLQDTPNAETNDRAYSAVGGALGFNFNSVAIYVQPGEKIGDSALVFTEPVSSLFRIINYAKTTDSSGGVGISNYSVSAKYDNEKITLSVYGTIGLGQPETVIYKRINNPALYVGTIIKEAFELYGIRVRGRVITGITPKNIKTIAEPPSYDLSYIIAGINKWSNNYAATQLLMVMGAQEFGPPGTDEKGIRAMKPFLEKVGITDKEINIVDGSGLDVGNKITPGAMIRLLEYMHHDFYSPEYLSSFSIAGLDGTERKRFKKNGGPFQRSRLKIGYLHSYSGLAGYIENRRGDRIAFCLLTNGFPKEYYESVKQLEDKICTILSNY